MWEVILALLIVLISILWRMASSQRCSPKADEEERVQFLLTMLVESRWSGLTYKLLWRHRLHRGLTSADALTAMDSRAQAASAVVPPMPTSPAVDPFRPHLVHVAVPMGQRLSPSHNEWSAAPAAPLVEQPEIPAAAQIPLCPMCGSQMLRRRNRVNHGAFWGCPAWPMCQGTRRPWDTGDSPQQH